MSNLPKWALEAKARREAITYNSEITKGKGWKVNNLTIISEGCVGDADFYWEEDARFIASCPETQERFEKALEIALKALLEISKECIHYNFPEELCDCSTDMSLLAEETFTKIEAFEKGK